MKKQKSIVIFSNAFDYSTLKVMEYLHCWKEKVIRINPEDTFESDLTVTISSHKQIYFDICINGIHLTLDNIKSIWFRRGGFSFQMIETSQILKEADILQKQINQYLSSEKQALNTFIYSILTKSKIKILGNPFLVNTNKLIVLAKANYYGLRIPNTHITTKRSNVARFIHNKGTLITKAIQDNFTPVIKDEGYGLLTQTINEGIMLNLPDTFFSSLFQEKLNKKFDIRIFYLDGQFFSIAIYSQENEKTATDFRNYDRQNPNRKNIFNLPSRIKKSLKELLNDLGLNTASIDMVYTKDNKYVFLEINPVGQYDMVGKPMNFYLDKKIATWLARN